MLVKNLALLFLMRNIVLLLEQPIITFMKLCKINIIFGDLNEIVTEYEEKCLEFLLTSTTEKAYSRGRCFGEKYSSKQNKIGISFFLTQKSH